MKKIYLISALMLICSLSTQAYVTSSEMTSKEFMRRDGFSSEIYRLVRLETEPEELANEKAKAKSKKFTYNLKKFYRYMDPYTDQGNFSVKDYGKQDDDFREIIKF